MAPPSFQENAVRAGFVPGPNLAEDIFRKIIAHPEGIWVGRVDPERNLSHLQTEDGKINLFIPELLAELKAVDAQREEAALVPDPRFPLILMAGKHASINANTLMRNPAWNAGRRDCTIAMHPADAQALNLTDGQMVRVTTEAGAEEIEVEVTGYGLSGSRGHPARLRPGLQWREVQGECEPPDEEHAPGLVPGPHTPLRPLPCRGPV